MIKIQNYFYQEDGVPHDGFRHFKLANASLITIQFEKRQEPITFLAVTGERRKRLEIELAENGAEL